ncbi:MAG: DUF362 domain-containing protein [Armatimonadetes bacterium]|nr:DUF362 domain-containing protein [Armatimonadota bacterium]
MSQEIVWRPRQPMDRRDMLRYTGALATAIGAGAVGAALHDRRTGADYFQDLANAHAVTLPRYDLKNPQMPTKLAVVHGRDAAMMVKAAFAAMGGLDKFISPGDVVLLKPNVAFDRPPELGATTSPEVLAAVANEVKRCGAKRILIADNPINQPEGCFEKSGITAVAKATGCEIILPTPDRFVDLAVGRTKQGNKLVGEPGAALDRWEVFYEPLRLANKVIGVAPCKDHNLSGASMTMKNFYGLLGGRRNQFHQCIHDVIADFPHLIKPTLVVLDATRILMKNGPTGGSLADVMPGNTVVVSTDMVAVDAFGWGLLQRPARPPEYLGRAKSRKLGEADIRHVPIDESTV